MGHRVTSVGAVEAAVAQGVLHDRPMEVVSFLDPALTGLVQDLGADGLVAGRSPVNPPPNVR